MIVDNQAQNSDCGEKLPNSLMMHGTAAALVLVLFVLPVTAQNVAISPRKHPASAPQKETAFRAEAALVVCVKQNADYRGRAGHA